MLDDRQCFIDHDVLVESDLDLRPRVGDRRILWLGGFVLHRTWKPKKWGSNPFACGSRIEAHHDDLAALTADPDPLLPLRRLVALGGEREPEDATREEAIAEAVRLFQVD